MKKLLLALALLCNVAHAQQEQTPIVIGMPYYASTSPNENSLNASTTRFGLGFNVSTAKTLTSFSVYCASETGTVASGDIHAALHPRETTAGAPHGTATEDVTADFSTACPGWVDFTFNTALTAHEQYYIVMRNANGTAASNYITIRRIALSNAQPSMGGGSGAGSSWGHSFRTSSDSGTTWATGNGSGAWGGFRFGFNGSAYTGIPVFNTVEDGNEAYSTRCTGSYFEVPADSPGLRVAGVSQIVNWNGTKPTQLVYRLYTGSTPSLLATTQAIEDESLESANWIPAYFSSVQTLAAGTIGRVCVGTPSGGSSGNAFTINRFDTRSDSDSRALLPLNVQATYYNGTTWAEDTSKAPPFALLLDTADPFDVSAGGGSDKNQGINGGLNK